MSATFTSNNGIYEGCAEVIIPTVSVVPGTNFVTSCSVALTQSLTCTATDSDGRENVPLQAIVNCIAALTHRSTKKVTNKIVGKLPSIHIVTQSCLFLSNNHISARTYSFRRDVLLNNVILAQDAQLIGINVIFGGLRVQLLLRLMIRAIAKK